MYEGSNVRECGFLKIINRFFFFFPVQNNWERSPSISSKGLSVAWKNLSVVAVQKISKVFGKSEYRSKEIIHNGKFIFLL